MDIKESALDGDYIDKENSADSSVSSMDIGNPAASVIVEEYLTMKIPAASVGEYLNMKNPAASVGEYLTMKIPAASVGKYLTMTKTAASTGSYMSMNYQQQPVLPDPLPVNYYNLSNIESR